MDSIDWKITPARIAISVVLLTAFGLWGGFIPPDVDLGNQHRLNKAWIMLAALFTGGAVCATMGEQYIGLMDRTSIRKVYLIGGIIAMLIALFFQHYLRSAHLNEVNEEEEVAWLEA